MRYVGIVGNEGAKFTTDLERQARACIRGILRRHPGCVVVSGHCHLGGIDLWAEQEAQAAGHETCIYEPDVLTWGDDGPRIGFKSRNLMIAETSCEVHNIVVANYPPAYTGMRFTSCYHCKKRMPTHVKSGGCWTAWQAKKMGKYTEWWIL